MYLLAGTPKLISLYFLYLSTTTKTLVLEIPALYSPDSPVRTNNTDVFRSHKQILKKTCSCNTLFASSVQKLFQSNIKIIGFSNQQNFLRKQIPVKKVVLIVLKTKDILMIVFNKNFQVKFLHIELKIAPKKYCTCPGKISLH